MKTLLVVNGHPDPRAERFCAGLSAAYQEGAEAGGWQVRRLDVGACPMSTLEALKHGCGDDATSMLEDLAWADRLAIIYPLWFGQPPQGLRLLFSYLDGLQPKGVRKAQIVVTMDMPAFAYRRMLRPGGEQTSPLLDLPGLIVEEPILIGCVSALAAEHCQRWLAAMHHYGECSTFGTNPTRSASLVSRTVAQWWGGL